MDSIVNRVYDDLRRRILQNEFGPNGVLVEQDIAEEYKVSRGSAREAMQKLCEARFLIKRPRKGYFIYNFSPREMQEIIHTRYYLEVGVVKHIIAHCTDEQIRDLYNCLDGEEYPTLPEKVVNRQFHLKMAEFTGNQFLVESLEKLLAFTVRTAIHQSTSSTKGKHETLIEALLARNEELACQRLADDLNLKPLSTIKDSFNQ